MSDAIKSERRPFQYSLRTLFVVMVVIAVLAGAVRSCQHYMYPYGWSHCCFSVITLALLQYAQNNGGYFPAGGTCPEASFSLLYRGPNGIAASYLSGKTKSAEKAEEILRRGGLLGPDTCDWHYVEGLTLFDDHRLALVWDKVGLGHNGQRLPQGGHSVSRLLGTEEVIPASQWQQFLDEQERLMAAKAAAAKKGLRGVTAKVRLPSGQVVDHFRAPYTLDEYHVSTTIGGLEASAHSSGPTLDISTLQFSQLPDNCTTTFVLSFNGWKSKPVVVRAWDGYAHPDTVVFEMRAEK
jgi:hypothetical protein